MPCVDVLVVLLMLEPGTDLLARLVGAHDRQPVPRRPVGRLGGDDLDDVAVAQPVVERHQSVVDLGADGAVADIGVDPVGEVERGGPVGQVLDVALGGEDEDLVLEDVELEPLHELGGVDHLALPLDQLADPGQLLVVTPVAARALLVAPVRGDPSLRHLVHLAGPDLDLERLGIGTDHGGVQRLVEVRLRHGDVVIELPRDRSPQRMHHAQGGVGVLHLLDDQPDGVQIVDLAELSALALHLAGDAVQVLGPAADLRLDADLGQLLAQDGDALVDERLALLATVGQHLDQLAELLRLGVLERQILELPLPLPDPQPMRQRRVDLHRLACDANLLVGRQGAERAHVVEPVGELDDDHPHVLGHGQEHLSDVLRLLLLHGAGRSELAELGDPVDQPCATSRPKRFSMSGNGQVGVLGDVVEERRGDALGVHLERRQLVGDRHRVGDVRLARCPQLPLVGGRRHLVGAFDQADVDARPMASRLGDDRFDGGRPGRLLRGP